MLVSLIYSCFGMQSNTSLVSYVVIDLNSSKLVPVIISENKYCNRLFVGKSGQAWSGWEQWIFQGMWAFNYFNYIIYS